MASYFDPSLVISAIVSILNMLQAMCQLFSREETGYTENKQKIIMEEINLNDRF